MPLDEKLVTELAKPFAKMVKSLEGFYSDPENKKKYQEWHLQKYGCLPGEREVEC